MSRYEELTDYLVHLHKEKAKTHECIKYATKELHETQEYKDELNRITEEG